MVPDLLVMLAGAAGPHAGDHFRAIPRPGFASMQENALANLGNNLLFLVEGRILPPWVTLAALIGSWILWRRGWRLSLAFYWAWVALFTLALSPFPFGDFRVAHSYDTWRFTLHVTLPMVLLGARAVEWLYRDGGTATRAGVAFVVAVAVLSTPVLYRGFVLDPHPLAATWRAVEQAAPHMQGGPVVVDTMDLALLLQEGFGLPATLGPVAPDRAQAAAREGPLYFCTSGGDVPSSWASLPLRMTGRFQVVRPSGEPATLTVWEW